MKFALKAVDPGRQVVALELLFHMGLDATIRRPDKKPLGDCKAVQSAISAAFPGVRFALERLDRATTRDIAEFLKHTVPSDVRGRLTHTKSEEWVGGDEGDGFSAEFMFPNESEIREVYVSLYGDTARANPRFSILHDMKGWEIVY